MINFIIKSLAAIIRSFFGFNYIKEQLIDIKILTAQTFINQIKMMPAVKKLNDIEFKVFSQFGDDGILQYLVYHLDILPSEQTFVEFGVENYEESNTRFLLMNNNWRGLIMDGSKSNVDHVKHSPHYWKHNLSVKAAFIDAENINDLISNEGFEGEIGILSIDIDGNDYWVWDKITVVNPIIVVAEYNGIFGFEHALSVPYDPAFKRTQAHYSNLYWGCSLAALNNLAIKKGYTFCGCNSAGNNAYFVRNNYINNNIPTPSLKEGFNNPVFKESRNKSGELSFLTGLKRLKEIRELSLIDVVTGKISSISKIFKV
jgi:hypothetical protein